MARVVSFIGAQIILILSTTHFLQACGFTCFCSENGKKGPLCNYTTFEEEEELQCTEKDGACYVMTENIENIVRVSYGCVSRALSFPHRPPIICEEVEKDTKAQVKCCYSDMCNRELSAPTLPSPTKQNTSKGDEQNWNSLKLEVVIAGGVCGVLFVAVALVAYKYLQSRLRQDRLLKTSPTSSLPDPTQVIVGIGDTMDSGSGAGMPLLIERSIARQVELLELIGKGRYGEVFRGMWLGKEVAVKKFVSRDEGSFFREEEIYLHTMLRDDNILKCIAADNKDNGTCTELWLITEYHENGSLFDYLGETKVNVSSMFKLASSIASGLAHLHMEIVGTKGKPPIAHRDLKSKNILVKNNGECAIADMGLAVCHDSVTDEIEIPLNNKVGTKRYMAPEVLDDTLNCSHFDAFRRADIYSLGLVFWEIARRCDIGGQDLDYQLPYYDCVPDDPSIEDMRMVVCEQERRPLKEDTWDKYESMRRFWKLMEECWYESPCARLAVMRVKKTIRKIEQNEESREVKV